MKNIKNNSCRVIGMYYDFELKEYRQLKSRYEKSKYQYIRNKQRSLLDNIYKLEKEQVSFLDKLPEKGKYLVICDNYRQVLKLKKYFEINLKNRNVNIDFYKEPSSPLVTKKTVFDNDLYKFMMSSCEDSLDLFFTYEFPGGTIYDMLSGVIIIRRNNTDFNYINFLSTKINIRLGDPFLIFDISLSYERFILFKSFNLNNRVLYNQDLASDMCRLRNIKHTWYSVYNLLKEYIEKFKILPTRNTLYKGYNLDTWLNTQRQLLYNSKLSKDKVKLLNDINALDSSREDSWHQNYKLVKEYKEKYKKLPLARTIYKGHKIGLWLSTQKTAYKRRKLSAYKIDLLSKTGVSFLPESLKWQRNYDLLTDFIKAHGRLPSKSTVYKDVRLGYWMFKQVSHKDELSQISYDKLADLTVFELHKNRGKTLLNKFKRENNCLPEKTTVYKGVALGLWCYSAGIIS